MTKLTKDQAMCAVKVLVGKRYLDIRDNRDAVEELIAQTRASDQKSVAVDTINLLLDLVGVDRNKIFWDLDSLSIAIRLAETFGPEADTAENLVKTAARCGYYAKFPELPKRLLNRQPDTEEVISLVSFYVENPGNRFKSIEQKLKYVTQAFLSKDEASVQLQRIERCR